MSRRRDGASGAPGPTDADRGLFQGRVIARVHTSPDGMRILVGTGARNNDLLTFKLADPDDFWLHSAGVSGAHVVVRNPERVQRLPRETLRMAAALAAAGSKARRGGKVAVHLTQRSNVTKPRGLAAGKVHIRRHTTVEGRPGEIADAD